VTLAKGIAASPANLDVRASFARGLEHSGAAFFEPATDPVQP
jgi:hypothetical protein